MESIMIFCFQLGARRVGLGSAREILPSATQRYPYTQWNELDRPGPERFRPIIMHEA
jgi:hypothetical protein